MLGPVLTLVNGPIVADALKDPNNRLAKLVAAEKDDAKVVNEIFLAILCRPPTPAELNEGVKAMRSTEAEHALLMAEYNRRVTAVQEHEKTLPARQAAWETGYKTLTPWELLEATEVKATKDVKLTKQSDGSYLASGPNPTPETYTLKFKTTLAGITALRLETLPDPSLGGQGPGRAPNGNFVLNEFKVTVAPADKPNEAKPVALHNAQADFSQESWAVAGAIDGNPDSGWAIAPQFGKAHTAAFELKEPIAASTGVIITITMEQRFPGKDHNLGRFRISATTAKAPIKLQGPPEALAKIFAVEEGKRTPEQKAELARYFRNLDQELARLSAAVAEFGNPGDKRLIGAGRGLALLNNPAFLFNH